MQGRKGHTHLVHNCINKSTECYSEFSKVVWIPSYMYTHLMSVALLALKQDSLRHETGSPWTGESLETHEVCMHEVQPQKPPTTFKSARDFHIYVHYTV